MKFYIGICHFILTMEYLCPKIIIFLANLFKYFKNHYTETPPPAPSQKVRQQNQLASLIKNLNVEQVQKLKKMNEPNPHYTPSDLDNVAHTPSELPFQSRPRVSMSRVGDDKVFFFSYCTLVEIRTGIQNNHYFRMISKDRQGLVEEIATMTPEEAGVVTGVVVDEEVEADEVTAADSVKIEDSRIDRLILIEVIKDGVVPLVVEVVGDLMTGSFFIYLMVSNNICSETKEDHHQDHVEEIMSGVMTMMTNVEVIVDHVEAAEVVVVAMISAVAVDVAVAEDEAVAEMVDHGVETEIVVVAVVEALQVYHVFMIHHHVVAAHGEIDPHLEWKDANPRLHIQNHQHVVAVEEDGEMHHLQQAAPVVAVGVAVRLENHHQVALDGVAVAVVEKPHHESHLPIEVSHQVVAVDGDHLQNHLDQHHGDRQPNNPKRKKVKVGEVQMLQLPVPNPQVVGNTKTNSFGHNEAKPIFCILYLPIDLISSIFRCLQLFYMSINKLYLIFVFVILQ